MYKIISIKRCINPETNKPFRELFVKRINTYWKRREADGDVKIAPSDIEVQKKTKAKDSK